MCVCVSLLKQTHVLKWKWYTQDWAWAGLEGTGKLHEQVAQIPRLSAPFAPAFLPQLALWVRLQIQEKPNLGAQMGQVSM